MKYSPKSMKQNLNENDFNFKKKFGQNFIVDENIINSIINKSEIDENTLVLEIGPGAGSLTYGSCKKAKFVLCYEIDTTLEKLLNENLKDYNNYKIIFEDFLNANVIDELKKYDYNNLYVVANLPYYITTPIIMKIINDKLPVDKIIIMVQKEVGDRFNAKCNTKEYNSLSIYLNYYYSIKKILDVSRNVFLPKPNVDSIVLEFSKKEKNSKLINEEIFFKLVRDSFKQKRKNLRNNLKEYDLHLIESVLKKYDKDLTYRAEQIDIDLYIEISNALYNNIER